MISKHILVRGKVQGIGFRYHTQRLAKELHLSGYVRNQLDGTVEILVQGDLSTIDTFCTRVRVGCGFVDALEITELEMDPLPPFTILH